MSKDCRACPLHLNAINVCVESDGPLSAKVLLVGIAPGEEENFADLAFVGKSGKLLHAMMADAGFARDDYRCTNVVRCVTPKNRVPSPSEITACSSHLIEEIEAMQPDVLIALGEVALKALVGNIVIAKARGQELTSKSEYGSRPVFVTYHPAFVLHSKGPGAIRRVITNDLRAVRDRGLEQTPIEWQPWSEYDGTFHSPLSYDIETYDEHGGIAKEPTQVAISDGSSTYVSTNAGELKDALRYLRDFSDNGGRIISHNGWTFDDHKTGVASTYDTMALAYLDDETQPLGLEALCVKYLGVRGWKEDKGAPLGTPELCAYNARDALYTIQLYRKLCEILGDRLKIIDHIIRPARLALDDISKRGVWINPEAVETARVTVQAQLDERRETLLRLIQASGFAQDTFDVQLKTKVRSVAINPRSNHHLGAVLEWLGFQLPRTPKSNEPEVTKQTLFYINHPIARAIEAFRESDKKMSTYIKPFALIAATGDGRARSTYGITRTLTGRTNSSGRESALFDDEDVLRRNLQNLDRDFKNFKDAPPGKVLVSADYAAVEFRMGAFIANEQVIIENYARDPGWDPHTWFARRLYNVGEVTREQRQIAKSANFASLFLGTGQTIVDYAAREMAMALTRRQGDAIQRGWHAAFPGWVPWYARIKEELKRQGWTQSLTGRRRNYGDFSLLGYEKRIEALREMCNAMVQGFCFDIAGIALGACHRARLPVVDFVHDDIKFEFDSMAQARAAEPSIRFCMIDEPLRVLREHFGIVPTVPLEIEVIYQANDRLQPALEAVG